MASPLLVSSPATPDLRASIRAILAPSWRLPKAELDKVIADYMTFSKEIEKSGHFNAGDGLEPGHTPTTVRVRNGKLSTSDAPQEKIKNTIGGFYVIRAKDLPEAIQVASRIPGARFGSVEVRPIHQYPAKD